MATTITSINRNDLSGLIPEPVTREIIQGVSEGSAVLSMGRRLPNMTSKTQAMNVLDMLPVAFWVDGDSGVKKTTKMAWSKKRIIAEELAVIVPIPEAVLDDSNYDIWGEIMPRLVEAFGQKIDDAILFGVDKPASWRKSIYETAMDAGAVVTSTGDTYTDLLGVDGVIAKVEESGFPASGALSAVKLRAVLRGLKDTSGQPIFKSDMQGATKYSIDGIPLTFPMNGSFDFEKALMIAGDFSQLVYAIRQDITYKRLDEATIVDPVTKEVIYSLAQQDMIALRAVMRLGWEIPNPINSFQPDESKRSPFAVYAPNGGVSVTPKNTTVAKGATQQFAAGGDGASGGVTWSVSGDKTVNSGTTVSTSGLLTVAAAETNTELTVKATSTKDTTKSGETTVRVGG